MKLIVSHPTGNRNVRAIIESLHAAGLLEEFCTTVAINPASKIIKFLPEVLKTELLRRTFTIPPYKINSSPSLEILRMTLPKLGLKKYTQKEGSIASIDAVYRKLDQDTAKRLTKLVSKKQIDAVYAYEDGALATFKMAKESGLKCIYDLPIAYWETGRKLMQADAERLPHWAGTLGGGIQDSPEKLERKTMEMEMADMIIAPGNFVIDSLPQWSQNKIRHVAAFGSPPSMRDSTGMSRPSGTVNRPLKILFAGSMGQRKGLGDLFSAMKLLNTKHIELVVMGSLLAPMDFYRKEYAGFTYEGGRSHEQVLELMRSCDVLCLPSIVEGRALVMQEAMSQGLPLIITPNTGGDDLIIEGKTGFLVPIRSPNAIAEKLSWFLDNRDKITDMGILAQQHAARYTWEAYGTSIAAAIKRSFN